MTQRDGVKTQIKFFAERENVREALNRAAEDDKRSVSVLVESILTDWLEAHGYLPKAKTGVATLT
jgi:hypothetical protein